MSPPSTVFIINPVSDFGRTLETWKQARLSLAALGLPVNEFITTSPGQAAALTRQSLTDGVLQVVAVGGDGTLNEVVNGYLDEDGAPINAACRIALLPSGTGSDFRKTLGIGDMAAAIQILVSNNSKQVDAGRVTYTTQDGESKSRFFINLLSIGLGGDVSGFVNGWRTRLPKWVGGKTRFTLAALRALSRYNNTTVEISLDPGCAGGQRLWASSNLIVVGNGRFAGGGMLLAPSACPDDGLLDVVVTDRASRFDVIRELPRIRRGGYIKNPKVKSLRARTVSIIAGRPLPVDMDGESVGVVPISVKVIPSAVRFAI